VTVLVATELAWEELRTTPLGVGAIQQHRQRETFVQVAGPGPKCTQIARIVPLASLATVTVHALRVRIFMMRRASKRALRTQVAAGADQCPTQPHPAGCPGPRRPRGESPPVPPARVACARAAPCHGGSSIRACGRAGSTPGARAANADPARGDDHCRRCRDCGLAARLFFFESIFIKSNP
jgi:hypothetical protein